MEPTYSYDQNAMSSDALRAVGLARGFDPETVNHPFFNQQHKHPFYPSTSGQQAGWPTPMSQPFPHPFSPQAFGSFAAGMQGYGAYPMGQHPYSSYFQNQQSYASLSPAQQAFADPSAAQLYRSNSHTEMTPSLGDPDHKIFDSSAAEQAPPSLNDVEQRISAPDIKPEAVYLHNAMEQGPSMPKTFRKDADQSGGQDEKRYNEVLQSHLNLKTLHDRENVHDSMIGDETTKTVEEKHGESQKRIEKAHSDGMAGSEVTNLKVAVSQTEYNVAGESSSSAKTTGTEQDVSQICGHAGTDQWDTKANNIIKEEPSDENTTRKNDKKDASSLKTLFPNLMSSCNSEASKFENATQSVESDESGKVEKSDRTHVSFEDRKSSSTLESNPTSGRSTSDGHLGQGQGQVQGSDSLSTKQPSVPPGGTFPPVPFPVTPPLDVIMAGMLNANESAGKATDPQTYTCPVCGKQLSDAGILARHLKIHTGERKHVCELCDKSFITSSELKKHIRSHTGEKPYACTQCERMFYDNSSLRRHMLYHSGEKRHRCHICGRAFAQVGNLRVHLKGKHAEPSAFFNCSACDARFDRQKELKAHLKTHVIGAPPRVLNQYGIDVNWIAPPSNTDLPNPASVDLSLVNKLANSKEASTSDDNITMLGKDAAQKASGMSEESSQSEPSTKSRLAEDGESSLTLAGRKEIRGSANAALSGGVAMLPQMGLAGPNLPSSGGMTLPANMPSPADMAAVAAAVIANQPVSSKPGYIIKDGVLFFVCVVCLEEFSETQAFKAHMRTHKINRPLPKLPCPVPGCHAILTGNSTFRRHLKTHTGARPHQCPECNKSFVHAADLTKHRRVHTDDRPHVCSQCSRGFHDSSSLRRHHFWHTGQKPYACPFCHKPFSHTGKLGAHMQSIHNADPDERYNCEFCPKSFCSVETVDKHIINKHADKFPDGYKPGTGARLGGVISNDGEKARPGASLHKPIRPPIKALLSNDVNNPANREHLPSMEPPMKKCKQDNLDDSNHSIASSGNSNFDSHSNPSHSESNSRPDVDSDSNVAGGSNTSKDLPPFESALRNMVSTLFSRMKREQGDEIGSNVSDSSEEEEEEGEDEGEGDEGEEDEVEGEEDEEGDEMEEVNGTNT